MDESSLAARGGQVRLPRNNADDQSPLSSGLFRVVLCEDTELDLPACWKAMGLSFDSSRGIALAI
jgi:hypothetical protein